MARDQLPDQHSLERVSRLHAHHRGARCRYLFRSLSGIGALTPESVIDLSKEGDAEIEVVRAAKRL